MLFERTDLMLRENLLHWTMVTAPSASPAPPTASPVAVARRWDFGLAGTLPQQTELARRAPGQGHGTMRGIHEMQMAQQGNAKQGLSAVAPCAVRQTWLSHSSVAADALITIHDRVGIVPISQKASWDKEIPVGNPSLAFV